MIAALRLWLALAAITVVVGVAALAYRLGVTCKEGDHWREKPFTPLWSVEK